MASISTCVNESALFQRNCQPQKADSAWRGSVSCEEQPDTAMSGALGLAFSWDLLSPTLLQVSGLLLPPHWLLAQPVPLGDFPPGGWTEVSYVGGTKDQRGARGGGVALFITMTMRWGQAESSCKR